MIFKDFWAKSGKGIWLKISPGWGGGEGGLLVVCCFVGCESFLIDWTPWDLMEKKCFFNIGVCFVLIMMYVLNDG